MSARRDWRIGLDFGGTKLEALLLDPDGRAVARERVPTPRDPDGARAALVGLVTGLEGRFGVRATVGLGLPGSVSPRTGLIRNANTVWLNGTRFPADLANALGRPVPAENDANCLALSEATDGAGAGAACVFAVILGTGVGGGVAFGGRVWGGGNGIAGEWGHNPLPWPTDEECARPPCWCGQRLCLETFLSGPAFAADHERATGETQRATEIAAAAAAGDEGAAASLARYLDRLARALATVVNLLDPDVIVLGGGVSNVPQLYEELPARMGAFTFSDGIATPIRPAAHGDSSGVRGAAWLGAAGR